MLLLGEGLDILTEAPSIIESVMTMSLIGSMGCAAGVVAVGGVAVMAC